MKWQTTILVVGLSLGAMQPVTNVITSGQTAMPVAQAATTAAKDDIQYQGDYGVHWFLTNSGELHLESGTLADSPIPSSTSKSGVNEGQFAKQIALAQNISAPTDAQLTAAGDLVKRVVLDGPVKTSANAANLFGQLSQVSEYDHLDLLDTSAATTMQGMFMAINSKGNTSLTSLDVSHFDTSHVTNMRNMFYQLVNVSDLDLSHFNMDQVTDTGSMFLGTRKIETVDLSRQALPSLVTANYMFSGSNIQQVLLNAFNPAPTFTGSSMFLGKSTIWRVTFGPKTHFSGTSYLNNPNTVNAPDFLKSWQAVGKGTIQNPLGDRYALGKDVTDLYTKDNPNKPTKVETYVWEPVKRVVEPTTPSVVTPTPQAQPVTVQYLDQQGHKLANDQTLTGSLGAKYTADQLKFDGYELGKTDGSTSGTFSTSAQTVTFRYVPDLSTGGDAATVAPISSVVYSTKKIGLYSSKDFSKKTLKHWYGKQKRTKRPMFVVTGFATAKNGALRYKVKDVNHGSKTAGKTGYITTKKAYVVNVYYQAKHKKIQVINPKGINSYQNKSLKSKKAHTYKKGQILRVKKIVSYHLTTRYQLTNGKYVTANKKLVIAK